MSSKIDYKPLGGKSRRFALISDETKTISRRQYDKLPFAEGLTQPKKLVERKKSHPKYSVLELRKIANTPNKELTSYQQTLKREWNKPRTGLELARLTGMDDRTAIRRIYGTSKAQVIGSSLRFRRGEGVTVKTEGGTEKFLVKIQKGGQEPVYAFYTNQSFSQLINSIGADERYKSLEGRVSIEKVYSDEVHELNNEEEDAA